MSILEIIGKIIIPVLVGVAILGSLQSIKTTSLDPRVDDTQDLLSQVGTTSFDVGSQGVDEDVAREQLKGMVVWNALTASDCRIATGSHLMTNMELHEGGFSGEKPLEYDTDSTGVNNFVTGGSDVPKIRGNNKNGFIGFDGYTDPLLNHGFEAQCLGTSSVIQETKEAMQESTSGILGGLGDLVGKAVAFAGGAAFALACGATVVCAGGAIAVYVVVDATYGTVAEYTGHLAGKIIVPGAYQNFHNDAGFDMEAQYGRIGFNMSQTIQFGAEDRYDPLFAMGINMKNNIEKTPGFWQGQRMMFAIPSGLDPGGKNKKWSNIAHDNIHFEKNGDFEGFNDGRADIRKLYSFRLRMVNVPVISDDDVDEDVLEQPCTGSSCGQPKKLLRSFVEETQYLFCKGAQGYIQSNSKQMDKTGEVTGTNSGEEDNVYPYLEIESGGKTCLEVPTGTEKNPSSVQNFDESTYSCDAVGDMGEEKGEVFSRSTTTGEMKVKMVCGGKQDSFTIPRYNDDGNMPGDTSIDYYKPQSYMKGCGSKKTFNITEDSDPTGSGDELEWIHDADDRYFEGDGVNEAKNQITYRNLRMRYNNDNSENKTFMIKIEGEVADPGGDVSTTRRIVVEDANIGGNQKRYTVNIYEGSGSNPSLMETETWESSSPGSTNVVKLMKTPGDGYPEMELKIRDELLVSDFWLGYLGSSDPEYEMQEIEIETLESGEIDKFNDETSNDVGANQEEIGINEVLTRGEPEVCYSP